MNALLLQQTFVEMTEFKSFVVQWTIVGAGPPPVPASETMVRFSVVVSVNTRFRTPICLQSFVLGDY